MRILDGAFLDALEALDINVQQMKSGHYSGARRSRAYGSSPEFADYREYVPGDDLRRIDWNAAARFDKYLIKVHRRKAGAQLGLSGYVRLHGL